DPDAQVRFRAAQGLIGGKDKTAVPALVELLGASSLGIRGQAESLLFRIAGESAPAICLCDGTYAARVTYRDAWSAWWREKAEAIDLEHLTLPESPRGSALVV